MWRGIGRKRHRERFPKCPCEPFGVSYQRAELDACVEVTQRKADEQGMDEGKRSGAVKCARKTFFAKRTQQAKAEWRAGRGRAVALKRAVNGGHLVRIVVPPQAKPGDFFAHRGVKGRPLKRTVDGRYVESKEEDMWVQETDARSDAATPGCPVGPVPDTRPDFMHITVWARELRPSEAAKAAAKVAEAAAAEVEVDCAEPEALAFDDDDDDDADDESGDDDEEGETEEGEAEEGEEGEVAPTAAAPAEPTEPAATPAAPAAPDTAIVVPAAAPAAMPIAVAAPAAAPVSAAADANARI